MESFLSVCHTNENILIPMDFLFDMNSSIVYKV